jgi:hypothetical protein
MSSFNPSWAKVTLEAIKQAQAFKLDMITFLSHTSYVFQHLNISCFKPFKTSFQKKMDEAMVRSNHLEPMQGDVG